MAKSLEQVMSEVAGVGEDQRLKLATFLEANKLRGAQAMEQILYGSGGVVVGGSLAAIELQGELSEHGKEMINEITNLLKDSVGKSAKDTRDILVKMKVINEALERSGTKEAKRIKEVMEPGLRALEAQGSLGNVFRDVIRGKAQNLGERMVRKVPLAGGIIGDVMSERKRRRGISAEQQTRLGEMVPETGGAEVAVANEDARKLADNIETIKENTAISAAADKDDKSKVEEAEEAGEESRMKKFMSNLGSVFGLDKFGKKKKASSGDEGGGGGGLFTELLAANSIGGMAKFLGKRILPALGSVIGPLAAVIGPVLAIGAVATGGFMLGKAISEKWILPMIEENFQRGQAGRNLANTQTALDVSFITESGEKEAAYHLPDLHELEQAGLDIDAIQERFGDRSVITATEAGEIAAQMGAHSVEEAMGEGGGQMFRRVQTLAVEGAGMEEGSLGTMKKEITMEDAEQRAREDREMDELGQMKAGFGKGGGKITEEQAKMARKKGMFINEGLNFVEYEKKIRGFLSKDLSGHSEKSRQSQADGLDAVLKMANERRQDLFRKSHQRSRAQIDHGFLSRSEVSRLVKAFPLANSGYGSSYWDDDNNEGKVMLYLNGVFDNETLSEVNENYGPTPGFEYARRGGGDYLMDGWSDLPGQIPGLATGGITKKSMLARLHAREAVVPLSTAMMDGAGKLSEAGRILVATLSGNALVKGSAAASPAGGQGGGVGIIAPQQTSIINTNESVFAGLPMTRNQDPTYIESNRRTVYS